MEQSVCDSLGAFGALTNSPLIAAIDLGLLAALILFSCGLAAVPRGMLRLWRQGTTVFDRCPRWWPYSARSWKGWVRSLPIGCLGALFLWLAGWMVLAGRSRITDGIAIVAWSGLVICIFTMATVMLWNRPKFVVPPTRREEPGFLQDRTR